MFHIYRFGHRIEYHYPPYTKLCIKEAFTSRLTSAPTGETDLLKFDTVCTQLLTATSRIHLPCRVRIMTKSCK